MAHAENSVLILGTRGVPANHGGFETFAQRFALFLVDRGWNVTVYCQEDVDKVVKPFIEDKWRGVNRIRVQVAGSGPRATLEFDWLCVRDAAKRPGLCLVLGYNTGFLIPYLRLRGRKVLTNMDGIEWRRPKWNRAIRAWFWVNERIAVWSSHRLVADHPAIAAHLATRGSAKSTVVIPYGGDPVYQAPERPARDLGLTPGRYLISIARIEPDNNILTLVEAFSRARRDAKLVVLGDLREDNPYHRSVRAAASDEVVFPGGLYDPHITRSLRFHCRAYLHGHIVGGTNPSLVEALWAGNAVVAHDNVYNRWTAGDAALFFNDTAACEDALARILRDDVLVRRLSTAARARAQAAFRWTDVCFAYERECQALLAGRETQGLLAGEAAAATPRWT